MYIVYKHTKSFKLWQSMKHWHEHMIRHYYIHVDTDKILKKYVIEHNYMCQCRVGVRHQHVSDMGHAFNLKCQCYISGHQAMRNQRAIIYTLML